MLQDLVHDYDVMLDCQLSPQPRYFMSIFLLLRFFSCSVHCVKLVRMVSQDVSTALRDMRETFVEGEELCQAIYLSF